MKNAKASDYIWWLKKQYPVGVTTFGPCANGCGMSARGGRVCAECLTKELEKVVGAELATELYLSISRLHRVECAVLEAAGEL